MKPGWRYLNKEPLVGPLLFKQHKGLYKQQQMGNTHQCPLHKEQDNPSVRFWGLPINFRAPMVENIRE